MSENQLHNFSKSFKNRLKKSKEWASLDLIFQALDKVNRLCWISGGAVRDILLEKSPHDFDLTTDATEEQILKLFPSAILVGRQFGVYKIPLNGEIFDLTVFREEDNYTDGRRPKEVRPSSPEKDACRRDFTINALYWDIKNEILIDYVNGLEDLLSGNIRCVGRPEARFQEDHLRILRMIRFACQFRFKVDPVAYQAGLSQVDLVRHISGERIIGEIFKIENIQSRCAFYRDDIFASIMKHNNFNFIDIENKLLNLAKGGSLFSVEQSSLLELFYLVGFNTLNLKALEMRFKFSSRLRKFLEKANELFEAVQQRKDYIYFCLLIDRSPDYLELIKYFSNLKLIDDLLSLQISDAYAEFPQALIGAQDVILIVPAHLITKTLSDVRAWQIQYKIHDHQACLDYVENKFRPVK